jgi:transposase-like protein
VEKRVYVSLEKRLEKLTWRMIGMVETLYGVDYDLEPNCPECQWTLKLIDVLKGFVRDVNDFTTRCPKCGHRFLVEAMAKYGRDSCGFRFYCSAQVLPRLKPLYRMTPRRICREYPDLYHSVLIHYGSIGAAMKKIGFKYRYSEKFNDWQSKIYKFIGQVPDVSIARVVGVSPSTVSRYRRKKKIKRYIVPKEGYSYWE